MAANVTRAITAGTRDQASQAKAGSAVTPATLDPRRPSAGPPKVAPSARASATAPPTSRPVATTRVAPAVPARRLTAPAFRR